MTSLNDFKNSILENKSPEIVQNYYCPLMCTLYLRNRYGDLDYDPVEYDGEYAAKYEDEIRDLLIREQSDCNMAEYFDGPNSAVGKLESAVWDVERIHGCALDFVQHRMNIDTQTMKHRRFRSSSRTSKRKICSRSERHLQRPMSLRKTW